MSLFDIIEEARLLGPRNLAFRVGWEVANRSGLRAMAEPIGTPPLPPTIPKLSAWMGGLRSDHPLLSVRRMVRDGAGADATRRLGGETGVEQARERADRVEDGEVELFRAFWATVGAPPNWHLEPRMRRSWPASAHWSTLLSHEDRNGDIKLTWELNRFLHVYDLIRGYAVDRRSSRAATFVEHLRSWEEGNPFRAGVNWASGQELAVRMLAWSYGVAAFADAEPFTQHDFERWYRLMYAHGVHIAAHLEFARRAVPNNHLLAEALGLLVAGTLLEVPEAAGWRETARTVISAATDQFDSDGGYCQNSHTYARFALEMWLEIVRWDVQSRYRYLPVVQRGVEHLSAFASSAGRLPNWGNNDGSTLTPWTSCDYDDFRPVLAAARYACDATLGPEGPWDEAVAWRFGAGALDAGRRNVTPPRRVDFGASGLYARTSGTARAVLRCGPMHERTGHADQLHVDVWFDDVEVACDAGSYSYHYDPAFHRWASGAASHNVVTVGGVEPMKLLRKFKWHGFEPGLALYHDEERVEALWPAMERAGVRWRRTVAVVEGLVTVTDEVASLQRESLDVRLHWLLCGTGWDRAGLGWSRDGVVVTIDAPDDCEVDVVTGRDGVVRGWQSRQYGIREPATSITLVASGQRLRFVTRFERP